MKYKSTTIEHWQRCRKFIDIHVQIKWMKHGCKKKYNHVDHLNGN